MKNARMGVVTYTLLKLYDNDEDRDANKDNIKKYIKRLSNHLEKNKVFSFDVKKYSKEEQSEFFAKWYQLYKEGEKINRQILSNLIKMSWSLDWTDIIAYFLSAAGEGQKETIERNIKKLKSDIKEKNETLRKLIRCQDSEVRGKENFYYDLKSKRKEINKEINRELSQVGDNTFLENLLYFTNAENLMTDFFMQNLTYNISDNINPSIQQRINRLQFIEDKLKDYYVESMGSNDTNDDIFKDFSVILVYLNRRKELLAYHNVTEHLLQQIQEGYSMDIEPRYHYSRTIIGIDTKTDFLKEYVTKDETIEIPKGLSKDDFFKRLVNLTKKRFEKENPKLGSCELIIDEKRIQRLILESEKHVRDFRKKLEESWDICIYLQKEWNRKIYPFYLQSIKNIYREIFLDKDCFCNRKATTIIRNLQEDSKIEETINSKFILEKISRGFYREREIGQLYAPETKVQKLYYEKVLEIYSIKNIKKAIEELKKLVGFMDDLLLDSMDKI